MDMFSCLLGSAIEEELLGQSATTRQVFKKRLRQSAVSELRLLRSGAARYCQALTAKVS